MGVKYNKGTMVRWKNWKKWGITWLGLIHFPEIFVSGNLKISGSPKNLFFLLSKINDILVDL